MQQIEPLTIADGQQALRVVRQRAAEWGIAPERIGIMGFSSGGVVTTGAAMQYDADGGGSKSAPLCRVERCRSPGRIAHLCSGWSWLRDEKAGTAK